MEEKTFTQEEVNEIVGKRLKEAEKRWADKYSNYLSPDDFQGKTDELNKQIATLTASIEEGKTKTDADAGIISDLQGKIAKFETDAMKIRIASEVGLPTELANRLSGETEEDYKKDAETLKNFMNVSTTMPLRKPEPDNPGDAQDQAFRDLLEGLKK